MKVSSSFRGNKGSRSIDPRMLAAAADDSKCWNAVGIVIKSGASHFEKTAGDVRVWVEFQPSRLQIFCRLGCFAGGAGMGLWRIPAVGAEVMVALPMGRIDFMPTIIAQLSTGNVPVAVGDDKTALVAPDEIRFIAPKVTTETAESFLGSGSATQQMIKGTLYKADEVTFLGLLVTFVGAVSSAAASTTPTAPQLAALTAATAALTSGIATFSAGQHLSFKHKLDS